MRTVMSKDGTPIAFVQSGQGPALILVVGAFNDRSTGLPLAAVLSEHFTVFNYDRRGRGMSGDTAPYAIEREIDDIDALITEAGGSACVFGYSSGAIGAARSPTAPRVPRSSSSRQSGTAWLASRRPGGRRTPGGSPRSPWPCWPSAGWRATPTACGRTGGA